jgi:hypothetical protein
VQRGDGEGNGPRGTILTERSWRRSPLEVSGSIDPLSPREAERRAFIESVEVSARAGSSPERPPSPAPGV